MAKKPPVCEACKGGKYGLRVEQLGPGVCCKPGEDGHLPPGAKQAVKCTACRQPTGYCTQLGKPGHLSADRCKKIPKTGTPTKPATNQQSNSAQKKNKRGLDSTSPKNGKKKKNSKKRSRYARCFFTLVHDQSSLYSGTINLGRRKKLTMENGKQMRRR